MILSHRQIGAFFLLFVLAVLSVQNLSATEIYRWVDENGNVHYGEEPPPDSSKEQKKMKLEPLPSSGANLATDKQIKNLHKGNEEAVKREQQRAKEQEKVVEKKKKYCEQKRQELVKVQAYLEGVDNARDRRKEKALLELLARECR